MILNILIATLVVALLGLLLGLFLSFSSEKFKVVVDEKIEKVRECLPGNNCGGCGYAGCDALAVAIVNNKIPVSSCPVGGKDVADKIAKIVGATNVDTKRMVAYVRCNGTCLNTKKVYNYYGVNDCRAISTIPNKGEKGCTYACMGYGTCVKVCKFNAIKIVDGVAVVDKNKCTGCSSCVKICPMNVIDLVPFDNKFHVRCNSIDKGNIVTKVCSNGCIGCKMCEKKCTVEAIKVNNNLAMIDYNICINCGLCKETCPKKVIN